MSNSSNDHKKDFVMNLVKDPVITRPEAIGVVPSGEFDASALSGIQCQGVNPVCHPHLYLSGQDLELPQS